MRAADVETIPELVADRPAGPHTETLGVVGAIGHLPLTGEAFGRPLRHDVDHAADSSLTVKHGCRSAQHLDAFCRPGVERKGDRAGTDIEPRAVIEPHHRVVADEAASGEPRAAVARRGRRGEAAGVLGHGIDHAGLAAVMDGHTGNDLDTGWRLQRRQTEAAAGLTGNVEVEPGLRSPGRTAGIRLTAE